MNDDTLTLILMATWSAFVLAILLFIRARLVQARRRARELRLIERRLADLLQRADLWQPGGEPDRLEPYRAWTERNL